MKRHRMLWIGVVVGLAAVATPVMPAAHAGGNLPPGTPISCNLSGFVVSQAGDVTQAGDVSTGVFGSANVAGTPLPSQVTCTGAINGTATVSGGFTSCHNTHADFHPTPSTTITWPCGPKDMFDPLYDPSIPTNTHVYGANESLSSTSWQWADGGTAPSCSFGFFGHALAPVELTVTATCGSHTIVFPAPNAIGFTPLLDASGDFTHRADVGNSCTSGPTCVGGTIHDYQHCITNDPSHKHVSSLSGTETSKTFDQEQPGHRPFCFRSVIFNGTLTGTLTS